MSIAPILRPRVLVMFALALILSVSAYGFAAANTVPLSAVGDSDAVISGYAVTNVVYTLDTSTNPSKITQVNFSIAPLSGGPAVAAAKVQLLTGGALFTCDVTTPATTTCAITGGGVDTETAVNLRVIASSTATL